MKYLNKILLLVLFFLNIISAQEKSDSSAIALESELFSPSRVDRLFSIQTGDVLQSGDFNVSLGGAFGMTGVQGILGTLNLGLGGYGDLELSSASLIGSVFGSDESFAHIGMKIKIFSEEESIPAMSIGLKTNNSWNSSSLSHGDIQSTAPELYIDGVRSVDYNSRITQAYISLSKALNNKIRLNLGVSFSDIRYKDVYTWYNDYMSYYQNELEEQVNSFNIFGGIDLKLNSRTSFMFEIQSIPYLNVNTDNGNIFAERIVAGSVGLRFVIKNWLMIDSGARYQDNYKGLADTELKIGVIGVWNFQF